MLTLLICVLLCLVLALRGFPLVFLLWLIAVLCWGFGIHDLLCILFNTLFCLCLVVVYFVYV